MRMVMDGSQRVKSDRRGGRMGRQHHRQGASAGPVTFTVLKILKRAILKRKGLRAER